MISGQYDVAVAGGVEMMSVIPLGAAARAGDYGPMHGPLVLGRYDIERFNQGLGAQMIADEYGISRADMDRHGLDSHARAAAAVDAGRFAGQIAPVAVTDAEGGGGRGSRRGPRTTWP